MDHWHEGVARLGVGWDVRGESAGEMSDGYTGGVRLVLCVGGEYICTDRDGECAEHAFGANEREDKGDLHIHTDRRFKQFRTPG